MGQALAPRVVEDDGLGNCSLCCAGWKAGRQGLI
jgi:hypothetical protein